MNGRREHAPALVFALAAALLASGCFFFDGGDFNQIYFSGYVRSATDSSAVPGARVSFLILTDEDPPVYSRITDYQGYYHEHATIPVNSLSSEVEQREWLVTVEDVDGDSNGVFITQDTIVIEDDPQNNLETSFHLDFYILPDSAWFDPAGRE